MKPGYKTTEFWLSFAAMVLGFVMASGVVVDGSQAEKMLGMAVGTLAALGYTASRTQAKKTPPSDGPELP